MKRALACCGLLLATACGHHDTPVATYHATLPELGGAGSGGVGAGGAATAGTNAGGTAGAPFEPACPATYLAVPGLTSRYRTVTTGAIWPKAELDCEADGAHLIVIDSDAENTWMSSVALASVTDSKSTNHLSWLGIGDTASESAFRWVTGATLGLAHWNDSEPNSLYDDEDCVEIHSLGTWNDDRCNASLTYVCECDGAPSAFEWCDTNAAETCGDCNTACAADQTCSKQQCR